MECHNRAAAAAAKRAFGCKTSRCTLGVGAARIFPATDIVDDGGDEGGESNDFGKVEEGIGRDDETDRRRSLRLLVDLLAFPAISRAKTRGLERLKDEGEEEVSC
mmetsp:Transcript_10986/g.15226  ORF Transcript_10986/g.15226 Transcript_10986/m.15226 type:complete len:105 (+) Transcript_10986:75-389(+)